MTFDLKSFAERSRYRPGSVALITFEYLPLASVLVGVSNWIAFIAAIVAAIVLTIITYHRFRDASLSPAWLLLMIVPFGIGPAWHLADNMTFNLGGAIISMVPVVLGWIAPAKDARSDLA